MSRYSKILITGGNGMLAFAFKKRFADAGIAATFVDRKALDISDLAACQKIFSDIRPTLVINCAAYTKVDLAEKEIDIANSINGAGVGNLARLCAEYDTMLVHYSTDYVFDGTRREPLTPTDPLGPLSAYGKSKLLGEQLLQQNTRSKWLILRTAWLYGPGGPSFPATMVNLARQGKPLKIVCDQIGTPTFTFDLVDATLELIHKGANGIWHLSNSGQTNWYEFTQNILEEFSLKTDLSSITSDDWKRMKPDSAIRPAYSVLDLSPYESFIRNPMPHWRDALHRYRTSIESV